MKSSIRIESTFNPNPSQLKFFQSNKKYLLANGGYGSGKSTIVCQKAIVVSMKHSGTVGLIGRRTYPELRDTTRRVFFHELPKLLIKNWNQTNNHLVLRNGSEILFRALDDTFKVGSLELGWFAIDELSEFSNDETFNALRGRLRHPKGPHLGFAATNPATKESWLYKMFVEQQDPDFECFEIDTYANKDNLPQGYIKDLEKFPQEWQERYLRGKWGIVPKGTRVISKFHPSSHLGNFTYNSDLPLFRSWDFGFRHPAVLFAQETDWGRLLFLKEILGNEIQIDDFSHVVMRKTNEWFPNIIDIQDFCDIAGTQRSDKSKFTSVQVLNNMGIYPKYKRTVSIENELMNFNNIFEQMRRGLPRIGVDRKGCPIFSDALAGGYYRNEHGEATGDDYFDHLMDCARYLISNVYGVGIRRIVIPLRAPSYKTLSQARA